MRRMIPASLIILALAGMAGCGGARPSKYYTLELPAVPDARLNTYPVALRVGRISAPHFFHDDRIVYRNSGTEIGAYDYQRWAEPPTEMLETMLVRMLRGSGRYRSVEDQRSNTPGDFILRGRLYDFEEVDEGAIVARVVMEIDLYQQKTSTTVWSHFYSHDEPVNGKTVPAVVEALNRNVQRGLQEVAAGLDQYFAENASK